TETPPTEVEVTYEEPETDEGLAEEAEVNEDDDGYQAGWGDYAETGPQAPAQQGTETAASSQPSYSDLHQTYADNNYNPNNAVKFRPYIDQGWKLDQAGGVRDGVRPDMQDIDAPAENHDRTYGVIDTTPEVDDSSAFVGEPKIPGPGGDPTNPDMQN